MTAMTQEQRGHEPMEPIRYTVHTHGVPADATQTSDHYPPQVLTQHNLPNGRIILAQTRAIAEAISKDMDAHMVERKQR